MQCTYLALKTKSKKTVLVSFFTGNTVFLQGNAVIMGLNSILSHPIILFLRYMPKSEGFQTMHNYGIATDVVVVFPLGLICYLNSFEHTVILKIFIGNYENAVLTWKIEENCYFTNISQPSISQYYYTSITLLNLACYWCWCCVITNNECFLFLPDAQKLA